jgi:hypothetical protein
MAKEYYKLLYLTVGIAFACIFQNLNMGRDLLSCADFSSFAKDKIGYQLVSAYLLRKKKS